MTDDDLKAIEAHEDVDRYGYSLRRFEIASEDRRALIAEVRRLKALDDAARAYRFGIWNVSMLCGAWGVTNVERALLVRDGMTKESAILLAQSSDERDSRRKP